MYEPTNKIYCKLKHIIQVFQRSTNSTYFIPEIDGLRFYAIITVVIFHLNTAFSREIGLDDLGLSILGGQNTLGSPAWWLVRLDLGVKVFFSISGMVLSLPFLRYYVLNGPKIKLGDYFCRRLTRLEPPFVISLVLFLGVHTLLLDKQLLDLLPHFLAGLVYLHVFIYEYPNPINPVTWSLETETQFYILVPVFFALLFLRKSKIWTVVIILVSFATFVWLKGYIIHHGVTRLGSSIFAYFNNFLVGIFVAWLYMKYQEFVSRKNKIWDLLGLMAILGQFYFYKPQHHYLNHILFNAFVLLMMLATFKGTLMNWFFTRPVVYIIGGMCYSIYLLHYAFFHLLVKYTASLTTEGSYAMNLLIQILIAIPVVLLVSSAFYLLLEKPCMDKHWPKKLWNYCSTN